MRTRWLAIAGIAGITAGPLHAQIAQERVDLSVIQQIRQEGLERSQLPELARYLTEVIGPRLTGSPGMRQANDWTADMFRGWGLSNVTVEPWGEFGRGWERSAYSGRILTPFVQPLHAQPVSWSGSTNGTVTGSVVVMAVESMEDLERYRGQLRNAIVLMGDPTDIGPEFTQRDRRTELDDLFPQPMAQPGDRRPQFTPEMLEARRRQRDVQRAMTEMLAEEGAAAILRSSRFQYGMLNSVNGVREGRDAGAPEPGPQLIVAPEQYALIHRNVQAGIDVQLELDVQNNFFADDLQSYNTLADLPGSDKADEYIMLGAHLDSWHMGSGATDNAAGSVVMMEAMRILKTLGLQPRRTIRIALWSGEEQGLLGSRAWVANHEELHDDISAYVNLDNGTGKIRGIWDQSNEQVIPTFEQILWPFRDLGVVAVRHGDTGGTDHLAFDAAGIPGFNFIQDPIEYGLRTHHTDQDTFDHLLLDDLKQAAVVVAATVYNLAMREEMMPRKQALTN